ncbi:MAG: hypothetical protein K6U74_04900 [Firmicutes bacterium]|nr:hypothetical protein [Bacillota bacterium]
MMLDASRRQAEEARRLALERREAVGRCPGRGKIWIFTRAFLNVLRL